LLALVVGLGLAAPVEAAKPPPPIILPPLSYTPDDGLGLGLYVGAQKKLPTAEDGNTEARPWTWDLGVIGMIYLKPQPIAWGFAGTFSWFPKPTAPVELVFSLGSHGWHQDQWFGLGNATTRDIRQRAESDTVTDRWHRFGLYQVRADARLYYRLLPVVDVFGAAIVNYNRISIREDTLLAQQHAAGQIVGSDGGFFLSLDGGIRVDSRDSRIDPTSGGLLVATLQATLGAVGPSGRIALDARGFLSPPGRQVVFAGSVLAQRQFGAVPFYEYGIIVGPEPKPRHLTGVAGVRGSARGRIRGPDGLLLHGEARFRPPGFLLAKRISIRIEPIVFVDAARVGVLGTTSEGPALHFGVGGGCRFIIQEQTLFRIDVGTGPDLQTHHDGPHTAWNLGVYGTIGQSF